MRVRKVLDHGELILVDAKRLYSAVVSPEAGLDSKKPRHAVPCAACERVRWAFLSCSIAVFSALEFISSISLDFF